MTWRGQAIRFLLVGAVNTALTYAIFFLLALVIAPWLAYSIAFALGLAWVAFGSSRLVFRFRGHPGRVVAFVIAYLAIFGVGQLIIRLIDPHDTLSLLVTTGAVLVVTTPLTFVIGRTILAPDGRETARPIRPRAGGR